MPTTGTQPKNDIYLFPWWAKNQCNLSGKYTKSLSSSFHVHLSLIHLIISSIKQPTAAFFWLEEVPVLQERDFMLRWPGIRRAIIFMLEICVWRQIAFECVESFYADTRLCYEIISNSGMVADVIVQRIKTLGFE